MALLSPPVLPAVVEIRRRQHQSKRKCSKEMMVMAPQLVPVLNSRTLQQAMKLQLLLLPVVMQTQMQTTLHRRMQVKRSLVHLQMAPPLVKRPNQDQP